MYNDELNISFRWYLNDAPNDDPERALQRKHKNRSSYASSFKLYTQAHSLNPFQFYIPSARVTTQTYNVTGWRIVKAHITDPFGTLDPDDYIDVIDEINDASLPLVDYLYLLSIAGKGIYVTGCYKMQNINNPGKPFPFLIPNGDWYSAIEFQDGTIAVSEDFFVPCDTSGDDTDSVFFGASDMLRIDWRNSTDAYDIMYQNTDSADGFRNRLWLKESDFAENEPTFIEEGTKNDLEDFIQQRAIFLDNYTLKEFFPEWLYRALVLTRGHSEVIVWNKGYLYFGFFTVKACAMEWIDSGVDGIVTMKFQQASNKLIKSGCGANMAVGAVVPLSAVEDEVNIYPKTGIVSGFNVMTNDTGLGLSVGPIVGYMIGSTVFNLGTNGVMNITTAGAFTIGGFNYTLFDSYGSAPDSAAVLVRIIDWVPNVDSFYVTYASVLGGQTVFIFAASLLSNDVYPVNANNVTVVPGIYLSASGNHLSVNSAGFVTFFLNTVPPSWVDHFIISYYNADTASFKNQHLYIELV